jgi:predicted nucleic acid-binding protein
MMVADTDVLIDYLEGKGAVAQRIALELEHTQLCTTAVNRFELQAGARSPRQQKLVRELLEALPCLPLDAVSADRAAEVRRALEQRGQSIGMGDSLIAGITLASKGVLLTRNRQHFARVAGLALGTLGD